MKPDPSATVDRYPGAVTGHSMVITRDGKRTTIDFEAEKGYRDMHRIGETAEGRRRNSKHQTEG